MRPLVLGVLMLTSAIPACAPKPAQSAQRFGVNLAGCTFSKDMALCPREQDVDWAIAQGFKIIRLPVDDDMLLDPARRGRIVSLARYIQSKGAIVILDRHDYLRHSAPDALAFWSQVVPYFSEDTMIELANEPVKGYPAGSNSWMVSAQDTKDTVTLLRQKGIKNAILFGWPGYNAIFRADKGEPSTRPAESILTALDRVGGINDPLQRTYLSGHRYLDDGSSGTKKECTVSATSDANVGSFAKALRKRGLKAYITEFAFGNYAGVPASCLAPGRNMMESIKENSDVILGTTVWGGGRGWPDTYAFKLPPPAGLTVDPTYIGLLTGK